MTDLGIRNRLRAETHDLHATLDAAIGSLHPFANLRGYAVYLAMNRHLYETFGGAADVVCEKAAIPARSRELLAAIAHDLESVAGALASRPLSSQAEAVRGDHDSWAWGAAYVLEGSAMGAQFLVRDAQRKLPAPAATAFLTLLAGNGPRRFLGFCDALEKHVADAEQAVSGAHRVFNSAIAWIESHASFEAGARDPV